MKKAVGATFLLFYAAFTVVAISQHTASWASTISRHSPTQTKAMRAASPHSSQVRITEQPFVGFQIKTAFAPLETGPAVVRSSAIRFEVESGRFTPSRAPPAFL